MTFKVQVLEIVVEDDQIEGGRFDLLVRFDAVGSFNDRNLVFDDSSGHFQRKSVGFPLSFIVIGYEHSIWHGWSRRTYEEKGRKTTRIKGLNPHLQSAWEDRTSAAPSGISKLIH